MANYSAIKAAVNAYIKANGKKEITGRILNSVLNAAIDSLGKEFQFGGLLTPADDPGQPDQNVAYIGAAGTYSNFDNLVIESGNIGIFLWNGDWSFETIPVGKDYDNDIQSLTNGLQELSENIQELSDNVIHLDGINEEDLSIPEGGKLQFANRVYNAQQPNGMGYVILRKNKTFAEQVTEANTIYEIRYDFDLNDSGGESPVTIPAGCTLLFNGGKLLNGALIGSDTNISVKPETIFENIRISGSWKVPEIFDEWFSGDDDVVYLSLLSLLSDSVSNVLHINGNYTITTRNEVYLVKSNTTIELNGTITAKDGTLYGYQMLYICGSENVHVFGGGKIIGDKDSLLRPNPENGQWGHGIRVARSNNVIIEGLTITKCYGDGVCVGYDSNDMTVHNNGVIVRNMILDNNWRQGISITDGTDVIVENCTIKNTNGHSPSASIDIEPEAQCLCENISIRNCIFSDNVHGILVGRNTGATRQNSTLQHIEIENVSYSSPVGFYGVRLIDTDFVSIKNCSFSIGLAGTNVPTGVFVNGSNKNTTIQNCRFSVTHVSGVCLRVTGALGSVPEIIKIEDCSFDGKLNSAIKYAVNFVVKNCRFNHPVLFDGANDVASENVQFINNEIDITDIADSVLRNLVTSQMPASCLCVNSLSNACLTGNRFKDGNSSRTDIGSGMAMAMYNRCDQVKTENSIFVGNSLYECILSVNRNVTSGVQYTIRIDDNIDMASGSSVVNLVRLGGQSNTKDGHIHLYLDTWNATYGFRGVGNALDYDARIMNFRKGAKADITQYTASKLMNIAGETAYLTDDKKIILFNGTSWTNLDGTALS